MDNTNVIRDFLPALLEVVPEDINIEESGKTSKKHSAIQPKKYSVYQDKVIPVWDELSNRIDVIRAEGSGYVEDL